MRKLLLLSLFQCIIVCSAQAQTGGAGPSLGYSFGLLKSDVLAQRGFSKRLFSYGPSVGFDVIKGVAFSLRYDSYSAADSYTLPLGGFHHAKIKQNLGKFLIGFGVCDPEGGMFAVQFGFTVGHETAHISHEYPDGTISFGADDPGTGSYESFRALPPLVAISGGLSVAEGLIVFTHIEHGFKKGFGQSALQDWHFQKDLAYGVNAGGASGVNQLGNNDFRSWRIEFGVKYYFGF